MNKHLRAGLLVAFVAALAAAPARAAKTICVGDKHGCFPTIQAAVDAAHDGDRVKIAPGTFSGGVTIDVSIDVVGAGPGKTIIRGGGPVLTIGREQAATEPTVSISRVTVTGGFNTSSPDRAVTQGGGVQIPQGSFETRAGLGATVRISDSVVTGNRVASQQLSPPGFCGPFNCSFASGGGIFSAGTLTLTDTHVSDNQAGDPASITVVANGGGIAAGSQGSLTVEHSVVTGNRSIGALPWGDAATAAGVDARGGLTIENSIVSGNSAALSTKDPTDEGPIALAGGIGIGAHATIDHSSVSGNSVTAHNAGGQALAVAGGILDEGVLLLTSSTVARNHVSSSIPDSATATAFAGSGGMEVAGVATIRDSRFFKNSVATSAPAGFAGAGGGAITNFGQTTIERTILAGNKVTASGGAGFAHGGGIENITLFGPPPTLTLTDTLITGNTLSANAALAVQGGGLFTTFPVTLIRTVIAGNNPDQCFGC